MAIYAYIVTSKEDGQLMLTVLNKDREKCREMADKASSGGDVLSTYPFNKFNHFFIIETMDV